MPRLPFRAAVLCAALLAAAPRAAAQTSQAALRFYGTGQGQQDRVRIQLDDNAPGPDASAPCDVGQAGFTLELWLRGTLADNGSSSSGGDQSFDDNRWISGNIVLDRDIWGDSARDFGVSLAGGRVRFGTGPGDGPGGSGDQENTIEGSTLVLDGAWHHVACVRDAASGKKSIYVDGQLDFQSPAGVSTADISYPDLGVANPVTPWNPYLVVAAEKHDAGPAYPSFAGFVDELRIWSTARTPAEIAATWNGLVPAGTPGLVASYRFEEGSGTSVADTSGAGSPAGLLIAGVPGDGEWVAWAADPANVAPLGGGSSVVVTIDSQPSGIAVQVDGILRATPYAFPSTPGAVHALAAAIHGVLGGEAYGFTGWSDGRAELARGFTVPRGSGSLGAQYAAFPAQSAAIAVPAAVRNADYHPPEGQQHANAYDPLALCAGRDGAGVYQMGLEFPLSIPPGHAVFSAALELTATADQAGSPTLLVRAYDVADAPPFAAGSAVPLTAHAPLVPAAIAWTPGPFVPAQVHVSPELAALVAAVVQRADWAPGGHVGIVLDGGPTAGDQWRCAGNFASGSPPLLRVVHGPLPAAFRMRPFAGPVVPK